MSKTEEQSNKRKAQYPNHSLLHPCLWVGAGTDLAYKQWGVGGGTGPHSKIKLLKYIPNKKSWAPSSIGKKDPTPPKCHARVSSNIRSPSSRPILSPSRSPIIVSGTLRPVKQSCQVRHCSLPPSVCILCSHIFLSSLLCSKQWMNPGTPSYMLYLISLILIQQGIK